MSARALRPILALAVFGPALVAFAKSDPPGPPPVAFPPAEPIAKPGLNFVGNAGCAAAGCHGGNDPRGTRFSEYTTWAGSDPHARAYGVLKSDRSKQMLRLYRGRPAGEDVHPESDAECLSCHAPAGLHRTPEFDLRSDAVGCESCHGPSRGWRTTHYTADWQSLSPAQKEHQGLRPTKDLAARVAMCAECHVGKAGQEVNHDLIAAGHPRLFFEYAAYHDLLPRHWGNENGGPFTAKAWAVGQVACALAATELLAARAAKGPWPELAEMNCYACHHGLTAEAGSPRFANKGALTANNWHRSLVGVVAEDGGVKPATWQAGAKRNALKGEADAAAGKLRGWLSRLKEPDVASLTKRLTDAAAANPDWDEAAQLYLALAAMHRAAPVPARRDGLMRLRDTLTFPPPGGNSPSAYSPDQFRGALKAIAHGTPDGGVQK